VTAVHVVVGVLMAVGLAGSVLPVVPGSPLILLGAAIHAFATDFSPIGWGRLAVLALLAVTGYAASNLAAVVGARRSGGSRWAVGGALLGLVLGLLVLGPVGLIAGPIAGAVAGEWWRSRDVDLSLRSGMGAALGVIAGTVAHFALSLAMVALFLWWVWRG
jgi:uncharacterized protein YqgC (DUF456 family)